MLLKNKTNQFQTVNGQKVRPWRVIHFEKDIKFNKDVFEEVKLESIVQEEKKDKKIIKKKKFMEDE